MANLWSQVKEGVTYLLYGPGSSAPSKALITSPITPPALRTSLVFDSHVLTEGQSRNPSKTKNPQTISSAWDENNQWGRDSAPRGWQGFTQQERKSIMLDLYMNIPASSTCVDVIAKRIFSGGFTVEKIDEEGPDNQEHYDTLMEFCLRVNDDWDFNQLGRSLIQDELIFGESYAEIVPKNGVPYQLVKVDCIPMGYQANKWGQIEAFYQEMQSTRKRNYVDPKNIIRWWFPHPKASVDPFAPIEKVTDPAVLDKKMFQWMISFFAKGGKFPYYFKGLGDQDEANRFMTWAVQNFLGEKNAHKPPVTWGNAEIAPLGNAGAIQMDFGKDQDRMEIKIYGAYGVPPAAASIIQTGAMGGHSEQEQDKMLIFNGCDPVKGMFFEKLNYRVTQRGFNIHDYRITSHYADYRSDADVAETEDKRIRNGSRTINEIRSEGGKRPYRGGGDVAVIVTTKEVTPVPRLDDLEDEQKQNAEIALTSAQAAADLAQTKAKQAKEPPLPVPPAMLPPGQNQQPASQGAKQPGKPVQANQKQQKQAAAPQAKQQEAIQLSLLDQAEESQQNTGAMVALMIPFDVGHQIAIAGGEPIDQLHITLAFLGEAVDIASQVPALKQALEIFASGQKPLSGKIAGLGRFDGPEEEPSPIIALPDIPGLPEFRQALVSVLASQGCPVNNAHGYTPHITLKYQDVAMSIPVNNLPQLNLFFDQMCLVVADERTYFPLLGQKQESTSPVPDNLWVRPDIDQAVEQLAAQGVVEVTWGDHPGSCDMCHNNAGVTVKLGQPFPSGHVLAPGHPHCVCPMEFTYADGHKEIEKSIYDPNATTSVNDPDDTQKLPAVKIAKRNVRVDQQ